MRNTLLRTLALGAGIILALSATAQALRLPVGNIVIVADGGFTPTTLPKRENAPIRLYGHAKFSTTDGTRPSPLRELTIEFDKHGAVETRGLEKCTMGKLVATTTKLARRLCPDAIVGKGFGTALVELPEQRGIEASSPLTLFNGPRIHGNPSVLGHAHIDYPGPTTYVISIEIEKIHNGRYGFRTVAKFPRIVNDYGSPLRGNLTIGRTWKYKGKTLSYANAHCADGRLQAHAEFSFKNGDSVAGTVFKTCKVAK